MRKVLVVLVIPLFVVAMFAEDYKIIQMQDGKYILSEEDAKTIAEHIVKLESLVDNYKQQISTLEQMNSLLKTQLDDLTKQVDLYKKQLAEYRSREVTGWIVVAAVVVGGIVFLFVR